MIRKILASKRAEGGYIDIVVGVVAVVMCLVVALSIFTVIFQKNTMDRIADDLIEVAAYSGAFGEEFDKKLASIKAKYGDAYTVEISVGDAGWYNAERKQVQLGDEMIIIVRRNSSLRRFDVANLAVNLSTKRVAASEKYWKTSDVDYDPGDPDTPPVQSEYTYIINISNKEFHQRDCTLVSSIPAVYRENTTKSFERLVSEGYTPCGECGPHNCVAAKVEAFDTSGHWGYCATCGSVAKKESHNLFLNNGIYNCVDCLYTEEYGDTYCRNCHAPITAGTIHYTDCRGYVVVTYHANGGVFVNDNTTNTVTWHKESATAVYGTYKQPVNTDSVFVGWYLDKEGIAQFDLKTADKAMVDVYAHWGTVQQIWIDAENRSWPEIGYTDTQDVNLEIPSRFQDANGQWYEVVGIDSDAFANATHLISINIPDTVTAIGTDAFYGCSNLKSVRLPNGLKAIEEGAFQNCSSLTSITTPASLTAIDAYAFHGCTSLGTVNLNDGLVYIDDYAFGNCTKLNKVIIPASVKTIGSNAFRACTSMDAIAFAHKNGENVDIQTNAFYTPKIIATKLSTRNTAILDYPWMGDNRTFVCDDLTITQSNRHWIGFTDTTTELEFPRYTVDEDGTLYHVTGVGSSAFADCNNLVSVTFPTSIKTIEASAFLDCLNLTNITFEHGNASEITIQEDAFQASQIVETKLSAINSAPLSYDWLADNRVLQYKDIVIDATNRHLVYTENFDGPQDVTIPSVLTINNEICRVVGIGADAFYETDIGNLTIAGTVQYIDNGAFTDSTVTRVTIEGNTLERIGYSAFENCRNLIYINLPDSVTEIQDCAFQCSGLMSITLPRGLTVISPSTFQECFDLENVSIPDSITTIASDAFCQCYTLSEIVIPSSVTLIEGNAFYECRALNNIVFGDNGNGPNANLEIENGAFFLQPQNALQTTIGIGNKATVPEAIRDYAWADDNRTLTATDYTATVSDKEFFAAWNIEAGLGSNTQLVLPEYFWHNGVYYRLTGIDEMAFSGTTYESVILPESITFINDRAFSNCQKLKSISFLANASYGKYVFENCAFESVSLPEGWESIPEGMFAKCAYLKTVSIPASVSIIEAHAFYESGFTTVVIPGSVREIGKSAFDANGNTRASVVNVTLNEGLITIGERAFAGGNITVLKLPSTVEEIDNYAFTGNDMTEVIIPASVNEISLGAFAYCNNLKMITFEHTTSDAVYLGKNAFYVGKTTDTTLTAQKDEIWNYNWEGDNRLLGSKTVNIDQSNRAWIGYTDTTTELDIPAHFTHDGKRYTVAGIGESAFADCSQLARVALPDTVTSIGANAFSCTGISEMYLPDSVQELGESAFEGCESLRTINIPEGIKTLPHGVFRDTALTSIQLPSTLTTIGDYAFSSATLTSVSVPEGVTIIGKNAFDQNRLASISLPSTLQTIGESAFADNQLTSVEIPAQVSQIGNSAFARNDKLQTITFKHQSTDAIVLGSAVFKTTSAYSESKLLITTLKAYPASVWSYDWQGDNRYLKPQELAIDASNRSWAAGYTAGATTITIPETVVHEGKRYTITGIDANAFQGCHSLTTVTLPETIGHIEENAFAGCSLTSINFPDAISYIGDNAFASNSFKTITVPNGVMSFGVGAFADNKALTSVTFEDGVTEVSSEMFKGCSTLKSVVFSEELETIGNAAFSGCNLTGKVVIPASVTQIGDEAFYGNDLLTSIAFDHASTDTVEIGVNAFWTSTQVSTNLSTYLNSVVYYDWDGDNRILQVEEFIVTPSNREKIGYTDDVSELNIPAIFASAKDGKLYKVVEIGDDAFNDCVNLEAVTLPDTVTKIGDCAFMYIPIAEMVLPEGVTEIGASAFECCSSLSSINIPEGVTRLEWGVFCETALTTIKLPSTLEVIDGYAFQNSDLISVTIPANVTYIGTNAFNVTSLTSVTIEAAGSELQIGNGAFYDTAITTIALPARVCQIDNKAFQGCNDLVNITFAHTQQSVTIADDAFMNTASATLETNLIAKQDAIWSYDWAGNNRLVEVQDIVIEADDALDFGYDPTDTTLIVPETYIGPDGIKRRVVGIGERAFYETCASTIVLPASVKSIGAYAFQDARQINSINLDNVTQIGEGAFDTSALTNLVLPSGITRIENSAFANCSMTKVVIPSNISYIADNAFGGCDILSTIVFEHDADDALTIVASAFDTNYYIATDVTSVHDAAWNYDWEASLRLLVGEEYTVTGSDLALFGYEPGNTELTIPASFVNSSGRLYKVTSIAEEAFFETELTKITLPEGLHTIGRRVFAESSLREINFPSTLHTIGDTAFECCRLDVVDLSQTSVAAIESYTFNDCGLDRVILPNTLKTIGLAAFSVGNMTEVVIPESVVAIDRYAFDCCYYLTTITFEHARDAEIAIGNYAFYIDDGTLQTTLVTDCDAVWLYDWTSDSRDIGIKDLTIDSTNRYWPEIGYTDNATSLTINSFITHEGQTYKVVAIGVSAFEESALKSVTLPKSLRTIEGSAFQASALTGISIPSGVTKIGWSAFQECDDLAYANIPASVQTIEGDAFSWCPSLINISFAHSTSDKLVIEDAAFYVNSSGNALTTWVNIIDGTTVPEQYDWESDNRVADFTRD